MIGQSGKPSGSEAQGAWPPLPYEAWKDTCENLHLWTQIVGKVRLTQTPWLNHSWHVTLYVTAKGLTTGPISHGHRTFEMCFDFLDHVLSIRTLDGDERRIALEPQSVAGFHASVLGALNALGLPVVINNKPNEIPVSIPFPQDRAVRSYDAAQAHNFWRVLVQADRVFSHFRTGFIGKCSPVHFFWGSFDLAVTRFSGRKAPLHPGGVPNLPDVITQEAYSHEVSSAGFWPGGGGIDYAAFYSYAYPEPKTFRTATMPEGAFFHTQLGIFILPYETVRNAEDPDKRLMEFLQGTYEAAARTGAWDRVGLECMRGRARVPRPLD